MYFIYFLAFVVGMVVIAQIVFIQFVEGKKWIEQAEEVTLRYETIEPIRGNIYSSDGSMLAVSIPIFEIRWDAVNPRDPVDPKISEAFFQQKVDSMALLLSRLFPDKSTKQYKAELLAARQTKNRYHLLKRNVTYPQLKELRRIPVFKLGKFKGGLIVIERTKRELPFKNLAYRTIGWDKDGSDYDVGLEGAYSETLSGKAGNHLMQKIGNGVWIPLNDEFEIAPQNGNDIITTIDAVLQDVANQALMKQLIEHEADHGCAVLMEVKTGHIKAIANLRRTGAGCYEEEYNYAIAESSEPGSTFKLASVLVALEDRVSDSGQIIHTGNGEINFANRRMRDTRTGGYGSISLKKAFEVSSNVGISKTIYDAYRNQPEKYIGGLYTLSINKPLGLEIEGEGIPFIKQTNHRTWSKVSLPWMSIGYELKITPLQLLVLYNAVANNGVMVKPMFVKEIRQLGTTVKKFEPTVINPSIASKQTINQVRKMLEGVVEYGTAKHLNNSVYKIAGKTGTAQIAADSRGYNKINYIASFVGYFPAEDPKYSCIVVINNPSKGAYYGGAIAAPVFKEIADRVYATNLSIQPRPDTAFVNLQEIQVAGYRSDFYKNTKNLDYKVLKTGSSDWICAKITPETVKLIDKADTAGRVPDVCGMTARDAVFFLERLGFKAKITGKGLVTKQTPVAGTPADEVKEIELLLSI